MHSLAVTHGVWLRCGDERAVHEFHVGVVVARRALELELDLLVRQPIQVMVPRGEVIDGRGMLYRPQDFKPVRHEGELALR